jgi:DNA polymerase epsilon subunit 1
LEWLQKNHLSGLKRKLLKVSFFNVQQLMDVRREVQPTITANSRRSAMASAVAALQAAQMGGDGRPKVGRLGSAVASFAGLGSTAAA